MKITREYDWLIKKILRKYYSTELDEEDLMQEGRIGIYEAQEKFNKYNGIKFSTFAYNYVRRRISRAIRDARPGGIKTSKHYYGKNSSNKDYDTKIHRLRTSLENVDSELSTFIDVDKIDNKILVENILKLLDKDEANILKDYYGIGTEKKIQKEIGEKLGIKRQTVQNRIKKILAKLSQKMVDKGYEKEYVDNYT